MSFWRSVACTPSWVLLFQSWVTMQPTISQRSQPLSIWCPYTIPIIWGSKFSWRHPHTMITWLALFLQVERWDFPRQQSPARSRINLSWGTLMTEFFPYHKAFDFFSWFYYIAKVEDPFPETPDSPAVCHLLCVAIVKVSCWYRWFKLWWKMDLFDNQWCTRAGILERRVDRSFYHTHRHLELATCPLPIIRNGRGW